MGRIRFKRLELATTLSELVGYKAGLALGLGALAEHMSEDGHVIQGDPESVVVIRSEELDEIVAGLLYSVGYTPVRRVVSPVLEFLHRYRAQPQKHALAGRIIEVFNDSVRAQTGRVGPVDANIAAEQILRRHGAEGLRMYLEFMEFVQVSLNQSPFTKIRRIEWTAQVELQELFESENLNVQYGTFLDQRFIDYMHRNFGAIDQIHWRKFEGLTCEFFEREGYKVEIGEGRDDGGIDARVWRADAAPGDPPAILVQCKRQKDKVGKTVVKALWADVVDEKANSGLIVTTSALAPGAAKVCTARAYPIIEANRATLMEWLEKMRTPEAGVFMGT